MNDIGIYLPDEECFEDPIGHEIMEEPVILASGHSYEKAILVEWWKNKQMRCPISSQEVNGYFPNDKLKNTIAAYTAFKESSSEQLMSNFEQLLQTIICPFTDEIMHMPTLVIGKAGDFKSKLLWCEGKEEQIRKDLEESKEEDNILEYTYTVDYKFKDVCEEIVKMTDALVKKIFSINDDSYLQQLFHSANNNPHIQQFLKKFFLRNPQCTFIDANKKEKLLALLNEQNNKNIFEFLSKAKANSVGVNILLTHLDDYIGNGLDVLYQLYKENHKIRLLELIALIAEAKNANGLLKEQAMAIKSAINNVCSLPKLRCGITFTAENNKDYLAIPDDSLFTCWSDRMNNNSWTLDFIVKRAIIMAFSKKRNQYNNMFFKKNGVIRPLSKQLPLGEVSLFAQTQAGKLLIVYTDGSVAILTLKAKPNRASIEVHFPFYNTCAVAWHAQQNQLVYASASLVYYWESNMTSKLYVEFEHAKVTALCVNSVNQLLIATDGHKVHVFEGEIATEVKSFAVKKRISAIYQMNHPVFSNVIILGHEGSFSLWNINSGKKITECEVPALNNIIEIKEYQGCILLIAENCLDAELWDMQAPPKLLHKISNISNYCLDEKNAVLLKQEHLSSECGWTQKRKEDELFREFRYVLHAEVEFKSPQQMLEDNDQDAGWVLI